MDRFGLIGKSLKHSFSKKYFTNKFTEEQIDAEYQLFELNNIEEIKSLVATNGYDLIGLNVTIPFKTEIIPYLTDLDPKAKEIGAVNTVLLKNDEWIGYNTDYFGFKNSLEKLIGSHVPKALVLGSGGASKAVQAVLKDMNLEFTVVSRNGEFNYSMIDSNCISQHRLIINTTPLGMYPEVDNCPELPYKHVGREHFLFDLVYNPLQTTFLAKGKERGATTKNGFEMLHLQAEKSWDIWTT